MMKAAWTLGVILLLAALVAACDTSSAGQGPTPVAAQAPAHCTIKNFEATVRQGPDAGMAYAGDLDLQADAQGHLTGTLTGKDSPALQVTGQVNGQAINLYIDAGGGQAITGVGTLQHDL